MKGREIQLYGCTPMFLKQFHMPQSFLCGTVVDQWAPFVFTINGELSQLTSIISSSNDGDGSILDLLCFFYPRSMSDEHGLKYWLIQRVLTTTHLVFGWLVLLVWVIHVPLRYQLIR